MFFFLCSRSQRSLLIFPLLFFPACWIFEWIERQSMLSTGKYSETPEFRFSENFQYCEMKLLQRNIVEPPLMHKIFRHQKLPETQKGSPMEFFDFVTRKHFRWVNVIAPFCKFFDTGNFQNHQNGHLTSLLQYSTTSCDTPTTVYQRGFTKPFKPDKLIASETIRNTRNIQRNQKVSPTFLVA